MNTVEIRTDFVNGQDYVENVPALDFKEIIKVTDGMKFNLTITIIDDKGKSVSIFFGTDGTCHIN